MGRQASDKRGLPAVLASPMLADRLATELTVAAEGVQGEDAMSRERRGFLAAAAVQVERFGSAAHLTDGQGYTEPEIQYRQGPRALGGTPGDALADLESGQATG